jgi:hypothetical protein
VEIRQALAANALDLGPPGRDNATGFGLVQSSAWSLLPTLTIHRIGPTTAAVSWLSPATGYDLQQSTNLSSGLWTLASEPINHDGTNKSIILNLTTSNRFFRLFKP